MKERVRARFRLSSIAKCTLVERCLDRVAGESGPTVATALEVAIANLDTNAASYYTQVWIVISNRSSSKETSRWQSIVKKRSATCWRRGPV